MRWAFLMLVAERVFSMWRITGPRVINAATSRHVGPCEYEIRTDAGVSRPLGLQAEKQQFALQPAFSVSLEYGDRALVCGEIVKCAL